MNREPLLRYVARTPQRFFTTRDVVNLSRKSPSVVVQGLRYLQRQEAVTRVYRGIWARTDGRPLDPFGLVPVLLPAHRAYVSFVSALHLHGIVGQVPQTITLASTAHTRVLRTTIAAFRVHRIGPDFFWGFDWYHGTGGFLIAAPEKALLDCLYLAGRRGRLYDHFPELDFPASFSFHRARLWGGKIRDTRLRAFVLSKLELTRQAAQSSGRGPAH